MQADEDKYYEEDLSDGLANISYLTKSDPSTDFTSGRDVFPRRFKVRRVDIFASPTLEVSVNSKVSRFTLDSGAEASCITMAECKRLGLEVEVSTNVKGKGEGVQYK